MQSGLDTDTSQNQGNFPDVEMLRNIQKWEELNLHIVVWVGGICFVGDSYSRDDPGFDFDFLLEKHDTTGASRSEVEEEVSGVADLTATARPAVDGPAFDDAKDGQYFLESRGCLDLDPPLDPGVVPVGTSVSMVLPA